MRLFNGNANSALAPVDPRMAARLRMDRLMPRLFMQTPPTAHSQSQMLMFKKPNSVRATDHLVPFYANSNSLMHSEDAHAQEANSMLPGQKSEIAGTVTAKADTQAQPAE